MRKKLRAADDIALDILVWVLMILFSATVVYPFWKMLVDSLSSPKDVYALGLKLWPGHPTLQAYREVFRQNTVGIAYVNTVIRAVFGTVLDTVVCFTAAYALSKRSLPLNRTLTLLMIFTMFFGGGLIANYLWIKQIGLYNNRLALILPGAANAFYIVIMRNFFRALPAELEESALIDGASVYRVLFRIVVPLSLPVVATVGLWSVVGHWNAWFDALIYTPDRNQIVLQVLLRRLLVEHQATQLMDFLQEDEGSLVEETVTAATLFVSIGPIILVYPFVQKYFVKGIMTGAVKG
jgi:putative aldouronate transport system permease protein